MGNCIRKESQMQWAGEDWDSPASETHFPGEESLLGDNAKGVSSPFSPSATPTSAAAAAAPTEVKIKITKKQLEELLGKMEVQGLTMQQLLAQLMNASDHFEDHQKSWRPALQSIPEIN